MVLNQCRKQLIRVLTRHICLKYLGVAWLPFLWSNVPVTLNMWIIQIINQTSLIFTSCVDIAQINRVVLSPVTLVVNIVFRSVSFIELWIQNLSLLEAYIAVGSVFARGLIVFICTCWEKASLVQKVVMILWASVRAWCITLVSLDAWIAHHYSF